MLSHKFPPEAIFHIACLSFFSPLKLNHVPLQTVPQVGQPLRHLHPRGRAALREPPQPPHDQEAGSVQAADDHD